MSSFDAVLKIRETLQFIPGPALPGRWKRTRSRSALSVIRPEVNKPAANNDAHTGDANLRAAEPEWEGQWRNLKFL